MIPRASITAWRSHVPWADNAHVEQDLMISRALIMLFTEPAIRNTLLFRGGTALNKLFFSPASRYSEDIDLVQMVPGGIGPIANPIQHLLKPLLGPPTFKNRANAVRMHFTVPSEFPPIVPLRLKVEINTREHFSVRPPIVVPFTVETPWFTGTTEIPTYTIDELLGTKMRALYQRIKGRDLYDLWVALDRQTGSPDEIINCFQAYMDHQRARVSRAEYEANLRAKMDDPRFLADTAPLLHPDVTYDQAQAFQMVMDTLVVRLPGGAWRGGKQ